MITSHLMRANFFMIKMLTFMLQLLNNRETLAKHVT